MLWAALSLPAEPARWHTWSCWSDRKPTPQFTAWEQLERPQRAYQCAKVLTPVLAVQCKTFQIVLKRQCWQHFSVSFVFLCWLTNWAAFAPCCYLSLQCAGFTSSLSVLCARWSLGLTNGLLPLGYFCLLHPAPPGFIRRSCPCKHTRMPHLACLDRKYGVFYAQPLLHWPR